MAEGEARLLALADALGQAVYECDAQGRLALVSPRLADLAGRPVVDGPLDALCAPEDRERVRAARAAASPGDRLVLEYRLAPAAGHAVPVRDVAVARATPEGVLLTGAIEDLRPRRRADALLAEGARLDSLSELAAGVAHEVNNALSGVLNYAQLAQRCPPGDPHVPESLDGILSEGRRILEMTRALLTYTRSSAPRAVQVGDLLRAAAAPIRRELRDELISLALDVPADVPPVEAIGCELQVALRYAIGWARATLRARGPGKKALTLAARFDEATYTVVLEVSEAAGGLARAATGDLQAAFEVERARGVLEQLGGRLDVQGEAARLVVPIA